MGELGATWAQVFTRVRREDVSFRYVKIKIPDRKYDRGGVNDVMHRKRARRIWGFEKSRVFAAEEEGWLSELAEGLRRVPHVVLVGGGANGKDVIERLCLSLPYVEKPLNSKLIKSFVPELRSRKYFLCFGIPMQSIYMSYEHSMYISHIHVWLCYNNCHFKPTKE